MVDRFSRTQVRIRRSYPEPPSVPGMEYVYRWDRIIAALSVLFLLAGLLGYGLYAWLPPTDPLGSVELDKIQRQNETLAGTPKQSEGAVKEPLPHPSESTATTNASTPQAGTEPVAEKTGPAGTASSSARSIAQPESESEKPERQLAHEAAEIDRDRIAETAAPVEIEIAKPAHVHPPARKELTDPATELAPALELGDVVDRITEQKTAGEERLESSAADAVDKLVTVESDAASETETGEASEMPPISAEEASNRIRFRSGNVSISSPAVKRFVLAQSVVANEPNGDLGDISLNAEGFASVSAFSEVVGLKGEILQYCWLREGKEVLRIHVPVHANRWRSHATKRIYEAMKGSWRAELRDSAGTLLANADFVF